MSEEGFRRFGQSEPPPAAEESAPAADTSGGFGSAGWREPSREDQVERITPAPGEPAESPGPPAPPRSTYDPGDSHDYGPGAGGFGGGFGSAPGGFGSSAPTPEKFPEDAGEKPKRRRKKAEPKHPRHTVAAVSTTVRVIRDAHGVPHIRAKREHDAWAALGFCVGQDRLWQMDLVRRQATGRMAELFGEKWLAHDALVRTAGIARRADVASRRVGGVAREVLAAYAGGVNAARASVVVPEAAELAYEIEPWSVAASLSVELYWAWAAAREVWPCKMVASREAGIGRLEAAKRLLPPEIDSGAAGNERRDLWRNLDLRTLEGIIPPEEFTSNRASGFAFVGADGKGALVGDVHGAPMAPASAYAAQLEAPGFHVAGLTLPGTPIFLAGRNAKVCWVGSGLVLDDVDLVAEDLDGIGNFRGRRGREKLARRLELVRVRDGEDRRIEVVETRNGPLLSELVRQLDAGAASSTPLAVRWGGNSLGTSVGGWVALARAASTDDVRGARQLLALGPAAFEIAAVDGEGSSVSLVAGMVPERAGGGGLVVRGWHAESEWRRMVSAPAVVSEGLVVAGGGKPRREPCFAFESASDRRERLVEILAGETSVSPDAAAMVQRDLADPGALRVFQKLRDVIGEQAFSAEEWDGAAAGDSRTAALVWTFLVRTLPPRLFPRESYGDLAAQWWHAQRVVSVLDPADAELVKVVRAAFADAAAVLGPVDGWASISSLDRTHPLAECEGFDSGGVPSASLAGSYGALSSVRLRGDRWPLEGGLLPSSRLRCDPSVPGASFVLAGGVSGAPSSVHFADQAASFDSGGWYEFSLGNEPAGALEELVP